MEWKRVLLPSLFILCAVVNQCEASTKSSSVDLKKWINNLFGGWFPRSSSSFKHKSSPSESPPLLESSFKSEEELLLSSRQYGGGGCSCSYENCVTTCTSLSSQCFRTCTISTEFCSSAYSTTTFTSYSVSTSVSMGVSSYFVSTFYSTATLYVPSSTTFSTGCETVTACCTATALAIAAGAAAVAIAVGVAVPLGIPTPVVTPPDIEILSFNNPIPENLNPPPGNLPDDGCGTSSGRFGGGQFNRRNSTQISGRNIRIKRQTRRNPNFGNVNDQTDGCNNTLSFNNCKTNCTRQKDENAIRKDRENDENWIRTHGTWNFTDNRNNCSQLDGECHQLLSSGPCGNNPRSWFTLDPVTLKGRCTPRLCGRGRVFVGETGLCHDSEDPNICKGGRKLFYTAYGDPICDCPVGTYPFPGELDECVALFTRGPCPFGQVVAFGQADNLQCTPSQCPFNGNEDVPLVPFEDGQCYPLGSQGPCRQQPFQLLGYDVFERRAVCVNVTAIGSPYFELDEEIDVLDENYNQLLPEFDDFSRVSFFETNQAGKRQGDPLTTGLIQLPAKFPKDPLLNSCRPGARNGNNYKCTNPILFFGKKRRVLQAVRAAFECPGGLTLQATGQCGNDSRSASCGPSYQFVESIGECRASLRF